MKRKISCRQWQSWISLLQ